MVFEIVILLAALSGVGICLGTGAFGSLTWLWVLPLGFVGSFLGLFLLAFLVVWLMAAVVQMDKPQEKDSTLYRKTAGWVIQLLLPVLRIRIHAEGLDKAPKEGRFLLACNHLNDIDPAVLLHCFPKSQLAFISKRENEKKLIIGPFLRKLMCQSVNRENDREAMKTILNCIRLIQEDLVSIGVFPEGYVSKDKKLHPFRSGVFKVAQRAKVPILVCTLRNTQYALKNALHLKPTDIHLHLVGVLQPQEIKGLTAIEVGSRVHAMMARDLGPELVLQENT